MCQHTLEARSGIQFQLARIAWCTRIFCGTSAGATVWTALEVCKKAPKGSNVLAMVPDTAERYLSTPLFGAIEAEMNEEEQALYKTTPLGVD